MLIYPPLLSEALRTALIGPAHASDDRYMLWLLDRWGIRLADRSSVGWLVIEAIELAAARVNGIDDDPQPVLERWVDRSCEASIGMTEADASLSEACLLMAMRDPMRSTKAVLRSYRTLMLHWRSVDASALEWLARERQSVSSISDIAAPGS